MKGKDFDPVCEESAPSPDTRELEEYEEYSRHELPRLVRSSLESVVNEKTQPLEEHLRSQLLTIIHDCQDRMFSAYKSKRARSREDSAGEKQPSGKAMAEIRSAVQEATPDIVSAVFRPVPPSFTGPDITHVRNASRQLNRQYEICDMDDADSGYATQCWQGSCIGVCNCSFPAGQMDSPEPSFPLTSTSYDLPIDSTDFDIEEQNHSTMLAFDDRFY
jgi:hypothetical protein